MCISFIAYSQNPGSISDKKNIIFPYRDGIYTGMSQSEYTSEPYWGKVQVTIEKGAYSNVNFEIRDTSLHETFNLDYAKHFAGNEVYIQQTKNDWNGVKTYPRKFLREQDITKVDGISGATWSYKIFKASLLDALNNAGVR
jgi:major membrane immunogen (membrane-anchored lipoprotein)